MDSTYHLCRLVRNLRTGNDVNARLARALAHIRADRTRQGEGQSCDAAGADAPLRVLPTAEPTGGHVVDKWR